MGGARHDAAAGRLRCGGSYGAGCLQIEHDTWQEQLAIISNRRPAACFRSSVKVSGARNITLRLKPLILNP